MLVMTVSARNGRPSWALDSDLAQGGEFMYLRTSENSEILENQKITHEHNADFYNIFGSLPHRLRRNVYMFRTSRDCSLLSN